MCCSTAFSRNLFLSSEVKHEDYEIFQGKSCPFIMLYNRWLKLHFARVCSYVHKEDCWKCSDVYCWLTAGALGARCSRFLTQLKGNSMIYLCRHRWEMELQLLPVRNPALEGGGWSAPRPGHFTPGKDPLPMVQEGGWARGSVWRNPTNINSHYFLPENAVDIT